MTIARLQDYQIKDFIAPGGTSAVFSALRRNAAIQTPWKVAVKFVWDTSLARYEAENLVALTDSRGVVNLMDYFELPYRLIAPYLDEMPEQAGSTYTATMVERDFSLNDETMVGCLVLQFLAGTPLVKQTVAAAEEEEQDYEDALSVKDLESGLWLRQTLAFEVDLEQRLDLLIQLADYVEDCHRNDVVHGDLKPQNILYNTENQKVTILDFGGSTEITRGSPGWQAPEHFQFVLGELDKLPKSTDIFLLGLFIHRLLGSRLFKGKKIEGLSGLVDRCLTDPDSRPEAGEVKRELKAIQKRLFAPRRRMLSSAAFIIIMGLIGIIIYQSTRPKVEIDPLVQKFGEDNGQSLVERSRTELINVPSKRVDFILTLMEHYQNPQAWPALKQNIVKARAIVHKRSNKDQALPEDAYSTINFLKVSDKGFAINTDYGFRQQSGFLEDDFYLESIQGVIAGWGTFDLNLKNFDGETRTRTISPFSFMVEIIEDNYVMFENITLHQLLKWVLPAVEYQLIYDCPDIAISGWIYYDDLDTFIERALEFVQWTRDGDSIHVTSCDIVEIYFTYFSHISFSKGDEFEPFVKALDNAIPVDIADPYGYLSEIQLPKNYRIEKIHWQSFLDLVLEEFCLTTEQRNGTVLIKP